MNLSIVCSGCGNPIWFWQIRDEEINEVYHHRCWLEADQRGWMCQCGNWQDDDSHCSKCGTQPPWGCDCGEHDEYEPEGWEQESYPYSTVFSHPWWNGVWDRKEAFHRMWLFIICLIKGHSPYLLPEDKHCNPFCPKCGTTKKAINQ